jgi:PAS domain S-box-containing protein
MSKSHSSGQPKPGVTLLSPACFRARLVGGVVLLNVFVCTLVGLSIQQSHHQYQERAEITTRNLTQVMENEIAGTIDTVDLALFAVMDEYKKQRTRNGADGKGLNAYIERVRSRLPEIDALRITDAQGMLIYGNDVVPAAKTSIADRSHFVRLRDDPKAGLVISKPQVSRANQKWVVALARRIDQPDGAFGGVALAPITLEHLARTFSAINVGPRGIVALRDGELGIIVRHPEPKEASGTTGNKSVANEYREMVAAGNTAGTFTVPADSDSIQRTYSYRKVGAHSLYVSVGLSPEDYLAEWRHDSAQLAALAAFFVLITLSAAWLAYRIWQRQVNAVEALVRQEARFRTVADCTFDWEYWKASPEKILYMTLSCERVTGYTREEFIADPGLLVRIVHAEDRHLMERHLREIADRIPDPDGTEVDFRIVRRDGEIRWIAHHCRAIFGRNGESMGRRIGNRDVTERKQAEKELTNSRNRYQGILHNMTDAYWRVDPGGRIVEANLAISKMHGYSIEELLRMSVSDFEVIESEEDTRKRIETIKREGHDIFESKHRCRDGRIIDVEISVNVSLDDPGHVDAFHRDITQRKQAAEKIQKSERHLRESQQVAKLGSWDLDLVTPKLDWSDETYHLFDQSPDKFCPSFDEFARLVHPDDRETMQTCFERALASDTSPYHVVVRIINASGREWVMEAFGAVKRDINDNPLSINGTAQDVTDRKQAEAELLRSNAELEQFSYSISHDMRQPLRMISSYLQLLQMNLADQLDNEKREYFHFAIDGARRMDAMMLGLLEYSRVGRKGEPPAWIESRAVLDETLLFLQPAIAEAQAVVRIDGDWPRIFVRPDEMLRLMQNLIGNALKFRVAGRTPEVTVSSETVENQWRMSVIDNGVGILSDQIGRLFQVFQRLQSRATYEGNGIGLALCRKIAEHHGGRIWAESAGEGQGSRFCVALPVSAGDPT